MESSTNLKALIIGATGATGRELTDLLLKSDYYTQVSVLVRRKIERWDKLDEKQKEKLKIILCDDLEILNKEKEEIMSTLKIDFNFDSLFCCLGSRTGKGEKEFTKVDFDYFVYSANLCEKFNIPHFSLISAKGADAKSWLLYFRVKGRADEECIKKNIPYISVLRPGAILDRDNDCRFGEKVLKFVPFIDKIKTTDLALAMMNDDLNYHLKWKSEQKEKVAKILVHKELESLKNQRI